MKLSSGYHYIPVSDLYRSAEWYAAHLGFQIVFEDPLYLELRNESGIRMMLIPNEDGIHCHMSYANGPQAVHGFIVPDPEAAYRQLEERGIQVGSMSRYQGLSFGFHDPDGNRIELWGDYPKALTAGDHAGARNREVRIQRLETPDQAEGWRAAFAKHGLVRSDDYYDDCLRENRNGTRMTLLAMVDGELAGCAHVKYISGYPYFRDHGIPEINDLNVFPGYRRKGIANQLLDQFESRVSATHKRIGIGVGLYRDYGQAQRIYCRRGYIPDGNGAAYHGQAVEPGSTIRVDDDLVLYFTKELSR